MGRKSNRYNCARTGGGGRAYAVAAGEEVGAMPRVRRLGGGDVGRGRAIPNVTILASWANFM